MPVDGPWPAIHAERRALIDDLRGLPDERWATPSLCADWSVRDVLGHLTATARVTPARFRRQFVAAGFRFHRMTARGVRDETAMPPASQLIVFEALAGSRSAPPGPPEAMLGEIIVHGEDIRRPLGIRHTYPEPALARAADFYIRSPLFVGARRRVAGLSLSATDSDWTAGTGPPVRGPLLALLLAVTGRPAAHEDLSGPGLPLLVHRR